MFFISTSTSMARSRSVSGRPRAASGGSHARRRRPARAAGRCRPASPAGTARRPGRRISSPSTSVIQSRPRRMATTRMPVCTGSSRSDSGRRARCEPSRTRTRCETSSALRQVGHQLAGDAEAVGDDAGDVDRGVADALDGEMTWSTDAMASASRGRRAARTQTARMSWTRSAMRSSSSLDLLGHVRVAEVEGGVGQVDHQLGGVLRLREHGPQVSGSCRPSVSCGTA